MNHGGERSEARCGVEQVSDRTPIGDVTVDDRGGHPEFFQGYGRGIQPVLPDVAEDQRVVPADDLGRSHTHATRTAVMTDTRFIPGPYTGRDYPGSVGLSGSWCG